MCIRDRISDAHLSSNEIKGPSINLEELKVRNEGLIILSGGIYNGFVPQLLKAKNDFKINERIEYIETNYNILGSSLVNSRLAGEVPFKEIRIPGDGHFSEHGHTVVANNIYRLIND